MPECHNCSHDGQGHAACLTCGGPAETNHKGQTFVSIDSTGACHGDGDGDVAQGFAERDAVLHAAARPEPRQDDPLDATRRQVAEFVAQLFALDLQSYKIVRHRFLHPGTPLRVIARRHGVSTQAIHQRLQILAEDWPAICALVNLPLTRKSARCAYAPPQSQVFAAQRSGKSPEKAAANNFSLSAQDAE